MDMYIKVRCKKESINIIKRFTFLVSIQLSQDFLGGLLKPKASVANITKIACFWITKHLGRHFFKKNTLPKNNFLANIYRFWLQVLWPSIKIKSLNSHCDCTILLPWGSATPMKTIVTLHMQKVWRHIDCYKRYLLVTYEWWSCNSIIMSDNHN